MQLLQLFSDAFFIKNFSFKNKLLRIFAIVRCKEASWKSLWALHLFALFRSVNHVSSTSIASKCFWIVISKYCFSLGSCWKYFLLHLHFNFYLKNTWSSKNASFFWYIDAFKRKVSINSRRWHFRSSLKICQISIKRKKLGRKVLTFAKE